MAFYEFMCVECPAQRVEEGKHIGALQIRDYPMKEAPPIGRKVKCCACGRKTAERIFSSGVAGHVRGSVVYDWKHGESMRTNVNGQDVRFTFVDHPHTDPEYQRDLGAMANKMGVTQNGISKARYDPKHGGMVVDVASNVKDPLGVMERAKKKGDVTFTKKKINTPVKRRK
jgi:hypothetical protein